MNLLELETDIRQNPAWQDERYNALMGTDAALPHTDLPEEITDITQTLFDDEDSPYTKLIKLESYFRSSGSIPIPSHRERCRTERTLSPIFTDETRILRVFCHGNGDTGPVGKTSPLVW